ncbi:MAG TPA: hypothetical protein VNM16_08855 [Bacillota bacterium]|nr:hypothetical protein [Bacillota bacterium]
MSDPRRGLTGQAALGAPPLPLRAIVAVGDARLEAHLERSAAIRLLAVVRDQASLERHVRAGGSLLVLSRHFAADAVAALDLLPAHWAALVLCGGAGRLASILGRVAHGRPQTRVLHGARLAPAAVERALQALARGMGVVTGG